MHAFITHMRAKPGKRDEVIRLTTVMLENPKLKMRPDRPDELDPALNYRI